MEKQSIALDKRLIAMEKCLLEREADTITWWLTLNLIIMAAITIAVMIYFSPTVKQIREDRTQIKEDRAQIKEDRAQASISAKNAQAASFFAQGNAKVEQGDWDGAIADYTEAIRL
ncbi:MAG: hypothetical protein CBC43_002360 [Rhizobiales bacterium TMED83]|nr:MAG: hypothetical protein CBC43_002360 [Rhizobiales bacterium TMED83]